MFVLNNNFYPEIIFVLYLLKDNLYSEFFQLYKEILKILINSFLNLSLDYYNLMKNIYCYQEITFLFSMDIILEL